MQGLSAVILALCLGAMVIIRFLSSFFFYESDIVKGKVYLYIFFFVQYAKSDPIERQELEMSVVLDGELRIREPNVSFATYTFSYQNNNNLGNCPISIPSL